VATYEQVHAGDTVLGHDNDVWGVEAIVQGPPLAVTLVKNGGHTRVVGYPPAGTQVIVIQPSDVSAEARAAQMFLDAALGVEIVAETWGV
jgi:hypothetical protein